MPHTGRLRAAYSSQFTGPHPRHVTAREHTQAPHTQTLCGRRRVRSTGHQLASCNSRSKTAKVLSCPRDALNSDGRGARAHARMPPRADPGTTAAPTTSTAYVAAQTCAVKNSTALAHLHRLLVTVRPTGHPSNPTQLTLLSDSRLLLTCRRFLKRLLLFRLLLLLLLLIVLCFSTFTSSHASCCSPPHPRLTCLRAAWWRCCPGSTRPRC